MKTTTLSVLVPQDTLKYVKALALQDNVSIETKAAQLIERALEEIEDDYFASEAAKRMGKGARYISHEEFWRKCL